MFCTTLRRRCSYARIVTDLTSFSGLALRESQLETHDLEIPLTPPTDHAEKRTTKPTRRDLRLLLLSPSSMTDARVEETLSRIEHFASLTGGIDIAIVFLLQSAPPFVSARSLTTAPGSANDVNINTSKGTHAYARLQAELQTRMPDASIPVLLLAELDRLPALVRAHVQALSQPVRSRPSPVAMTASAGSILSRCVAGPPMTDFEVAFTSDLFPSLRHLATAALRADSLRQVTGQGGQRTSSDGLIGDCGDGESAFALIRQQLRHGLADEMIDFWVDEWVAD